MDDHNPYLGTICTYTGVPFKPLEPRAEDVRIEDIAHHLSQQCRFSGATRDHYSVAQHCLHVSYQVPPEDALMGLLHDAAEAYLVDVPKTLKPSLKGYLEIEAGIMRAVAEKFGIPAVMPASVKLADYRMLVTERRDLMHAATWWVEDGAQPYIGTIVPLQPSEVKSLFLERFAELTHEQYVNRDVLRPL